jgi:hypothetical protein
VLCFAGVWNGFVWLAGAISGVLSIVIAPSGHFTTGKKQSFVLFWATRQAVSTKRSAAALAPG